MKKKTEMLVDPQVWELAAAFIDDEFDGVWGGGLPSTEQAQLVRRQLVSRAARAMQQAIEDECEAIRQELK